MRCGADVTRSRQATHEDLGMSTSSSGTPGPVAQRLFFTDFEGRPAEPEDVFVAGTDSRSDHPTRRPRVLRRGRHAGWGWLVRPGDRAEPLVT